MNDSAAAKPSAPSNVLIYKVADQYYGLPVELVDSVELAVAVDPLVDAPKSILGLINFRGTLMPVVSLRRKVAAEARDIHLTDRLILIQCNGMPLLMLVDDVEDVVEIDPADLKPADHLLPGLSELAQAGNYNSAVLLMHNVPRFFAEEFQFTEDTLKQHDNPALPC